MGFRTPPPTPGNLIHLPRLVGTPESINSPNRLKATQAPPMRDRRARGPIGLVLPR